MVAKLSAAQRRLRSLQAHPDALVQPERFAVEVEALRSQLAELEVAWEELEQQNDELIATREALERQRHRYLNLFDEAPFGYLVTDLHGVIEEVNHAAAAMIGADPDLLRGKPLAVYVVPEDRDDCWGLLSRACAGEPAGEVEFRIRPRRKGEPIAAVLTAARDGDEGEQAAKLRWTMRDISRTKAAEEALRASEERLRHSQRLEAVGRLAGGIAHSFNNLLAAMTFQCELLAERLTDGDERLGNVEEIQKAAERAAALARQLLAFGRRQVLQPRRLLLSEVIRDLEPLLRRIIGEHIRLETRLDPAGGAIHADLGQIEQVILNLVVNARDAMPRGGSLLLSTEEVELGEGDPAGELPPGRYVQLVVTDSGVGIAPEVREHLFEPFFTTKERGQGTGLGLATVHGIVYQSGGRIRVESEPGQGSRFTLLLPVAKDGAEEPEPSPRQSERRPRRGSEVVLLVEDEDNIRQPAVEILESRGYRVLSAPDAGQALAVAEKHRGPIHILVTDVVMPGLSGSQLAKRLARQRPEMRVLYISGYPEDAITHHGVLDSRQHFLQKPFPPGQFVERVREVLDGVAAGGGDDLGARED
jgi:two-component system cell cycle sensor histidine kinase/response regulator CckA